MDAEEKLRGLCDNIYAELGSIREAKNKFTRSILRLASSCADYGIHERSKIIAELFIEINNNFDKVDFDRVEKQLYQMIDDLFLFIRKH